MEKENKLESLKKNYEVIRKKHSLPEFEELNKDFQIEKISEYETDLLVREVRRFISDKLSNYLRFIEGLLNPVNVPVFVFSIVKSLSSEDREKLSEIYKRIARMEVKIIELDLEYDEKKEADAVREFSEIWQKDKKVLLEIVSTIDSNWDVKSSSAKKGYFG